MILRVVLQKLLCRHAKTGAKCKTVLTCCANLFKLHFVYYIGQHKTNFQNYVLHLFSSVNTVSFVRNISPCSDSRKLSVNFSGEVKQIIFRNDFYSTPKIKLVLLYYANIFKNNNYMVDSNQEN